RKARPCRRCGRQDEERVIDSKFFLAVPTGRPPSGRTGGAATNTRAAIRPARRRAAVVICSEAAGCCTSPLCRCKTQRPKTHSDKRWPVLSEREGKTGNPRGFPVRESARRKARPCRRCGRQG